MSDQQPDAPPTPASTRFAALVQLYQSCEPEVQNLFYREVCRHQEAQRQRRIREALSALNAPPIGAAMPPPQGLGASRTDSPC